MMCRSPYELNFLVSAYSLFYALGGVLFFTVPDKIGRLPSFKIFSTMNLLAQILTILTPVYWLKLTGYIVLGFSQLKSTLSYVYLFEFMHSRDKPFACSCINAMDALTPAIAGAFFLFVDLDVFPLYVTVVSISTVAYLTIMILNLETPMWLLHNGKTKEAISVFNYIAWFNGVEHRVPEEAQFIEAKGAETQSASNQP